MNNKIFTNKRIGILGKGGSGKSTVTVLLANALRKNGYTVCVVDADSTNFGLHKVLGLANEPKSLIDYFGGDMFSGGPINCPINDPLAISNATIDLDTISEEYYSYNGNGIFYIELGKMVNKGPGVGCDGPISKIARDLIIQREDSQIVTLIDVKAGLEDSARGVLTKMDWIVTVVDPTIASFEIAKDLNNIILQIKAGDLPPMTHIKSAEHIEEIKRMYTKSRIKGSFVMLSKIKDRTTERFVVNILREKNIKTVGTIYEDSSIALSWLKGTSLKDVGMNEDMVIALEKMEQEATQYKRKILEDSLRLQI